jgi:Ca-activated chloride channel family protein
MKALRTSAKLKLAAVFLIPLISTPVVTNAQKPANSDRASQQDEQDDVLRVETNLVTIPASVMDRNGRYVMDLKKEDFRIFEEGIEQEIAFFASVEQPFTVLFLLDTSGSMTPYMADLVRCANGFIRQLRPNDQLIAASFSDSVKVLFEATTVKELQKGIKLRPRAGDRNTMVYEAVDFALKRTKKINGRKAIILFSDGIGSGFTATAKGNLRDAEKQDTLIYTVQFGTFRLEVAGYLNKKYYLERIDEINGYMKGLAQKTGGRLYQVKNMSNLEETFRQVAEELRRQYSLGFYPKGPLEAGHRQHIKVQVRQPNLVVRARDSYIVDRELKKRK